MQIGNISGVNQSSFALNSSQLTQSANLISSGVTSSMLDGAGVAISERMRSQANATAMAQQNIDNSLSALQTGDAWMQQIGGILSRMSELSIQAQNGILNDQDLANINEEFTALGAEVDEIVNSRAVFNSNNLLDGSFNSETQVGPESGQTLNVKIESLADLANTVKGLDVTSAENAATALTSLTDAIDELAENRAATGGLQSRLHASNLLESESNIRAAESRIRDVDLASELTSMIKPQILTQVGVALQAQANQSQQTVLRLLG